MTQDHTLIEELTAADALGGLDDADRAMLTHQRAAHGDCDECRRIEDGFRETATLMALSLDPAPVDATMADAIVTAGRGGTATATATVLVVPPVTAAVPEGTADELSSRRDVRGRRWIGALAAAAAFVVLAVALGAFLAAGRTTTGRLAASEQQVVRFTPSQGVSGSLAMAYTPGKPGVVFWGTGLPDPGSGKAYEIWMISGGTPVSGGCVTPTDGHVAVYVNADLGTADHMAVTTEPTSCPAAPTGDQVMSAPLAV